jgi:hypothetical protein
MGSYVNKAAAGPRRPIPMGETSEAELGTDLTDLTDLPRTTTPEPS